MPLIRRDPPTPAENGQPGPGDLKSGDADTRRRAVRALGQCPEAVPVLIDALGWESDAAVIEAIFTALEAIPEAVLPLASLLRSDDASLRNGAVEALQAMPEAVRPLLPGLLSDGDADVRILAVEVVRCLPSGEVEALLCGVLEHEDDPNVCTAAVEVLAETGTAEAVPTLRRLAARFPSQPMLPFAARIAIERITGSGT
jgi:HEAT repeat protein